MPDIEENEVEALIKKNEGEYNEVRSDTIPEVKEEVVDEVVKEVVEEVEIVEEVEEEEPTEDLPGYLTKEQWAAAGKDPALFKDPKAYGDEYKRIQETRELKSELAGMKTQTQQIAESLSEWQEQQYNTIKADLEAKLVVATKDEDVGAALALKDQINDLKPAAKVDTPQQEHPTIQVFRAENPILDQHSPEFNLEFDKTVENLVNNRGGQLGWATRAPDEAEMKRVLSWAHGEAKGMHPDLFKSVKNRKTPAAPNKTKSDKIDSTAKLKNHVIDSKNPRNRTAAADMADFLKEKYGKDFDEDKFANNVVGE